jgi:hypothetical protein
MMKDMKTIWRILKYFFLTIVVVILVVLVYISIGFGKIDFKDQFSVTADYSNYYPEDYDSARDAFRTLSERVGAEYNGVQKLSIKVPSGIDDDLTVDLFYIPAQKDSANLFVLSSGVHGLEGGVGNAVQQMFMSEFLNEELLKNTGILMIHVVNPYGFKYIRRVTENNVDLNRNSSADNQLYKTINDGYTRVYDLVNPKGKVNVGSVENRFFFVKAINEIRKASLPVLRQAVLQGQYEYPEGLYFGGDEREPQIDSLKVKFETFTLPYDRILIVDLHTGYGERGKLHFFPNPLEGEKRERLENLFDGYSIDWGDSDDFYTVTGDFGGFIDSMNDEKDVYPVLFEYGTLNSQTTMGSLKSIHTMILENQGKQYGFKTERDSLRVKNNFREMYYPSSENWRNHIMEQTRDVFDVILPRFTEGRK